MPGTTRRWVRTFVTTAHKVGDVIRRPSFPPEAKGPPGQPEFPPDASWIQQVDMCWANLEREVLILWAVDYWADE